MKMNVKDSFKKDEVIFKDFVITKNPYKSFDKNTLEASINLLSVGSRFHKIDKKISEKDSIIFIPIMKDAVDCVNKILNIERKQQTKHLINEHKSLRSDLLHTLVENKSPKEVNKTLPFKDVLACLDDEYIKIMSFVKNKLTLYKNKENKNNKQVGYKSIIGYLEREVNEQEHKYHYQRQMANLLLKTKTEKSAHTHNTNVNKILNEFLNIVNKENKEEKRVILQMCNVVNNLEKEI
jgi:hypothetical protein